MNASLCRLLFRALIAGSFAACSTPAAHECPPEVAYCPCTTAADCPDPTDVCVANLCLPPTEYPDAAFDNGLGGRDTTEAEVGGDDATADDAATTDGPADAPAPDTEPDTDPDSALDTAPGDGGDDGGPADAITDADTAPDAPDDTGPDTGPDTADDAAVDSGSDSDADDDAALDVSTDAPDDGADGAGSDPWTVGDPFSVLFVGNSYVYTNDLPSAFRNLALQAGVPSAGLVVDSVTAGGYRLTQHAADAANTATVPRLRTLLVTGAGGLLPRWDAVVLQEQSQILGFPEGQPDRDGSIIAGTTLAGYAAAAGAQATLFMTWGYRVGDTLNPALYPDYLTMQSRLEAGYRALAARIDAAGHDWVIAPVGPAYRLVREADLAADRDPLAVLSWFTQLYSGDNSHPSGQGTYLTACVMVATMLGVDPTTLDGAFPGMTDVVLRDALQEIARDAVAAERAR